MEDITKSDYFFKCIQMLLGTLMYVDEDYDLRWAHKPSKVFRRILDNTLESIGKDTESLRIKMRRAN